MKFIKNKAKIFYFEIDLLKIKFYCIIHNIIHKIKVVIMAIFLEKELVSSTEFAKTFGSYLKKLKSKSVEKLAILKNNKIEAILVSKDDYIKMKNALNKLEEEQIKASIKCGLNNVKENKTHPINELWDKIDD